MITLISDLFSIIYFLCFIHCSHLFKLNKKKITNQMVRHAIRCTIRYNRNIYEFLASNILLQIYVTLRCSMDTLWVIIIYYMKTKLSRFRHTIKYVTTVHQHCILFNIAALQADIIFILHSNNNFVLSKFNDI